jgi:hypothetical protein
MQEHEVRELIERLTAAMDPTEEYEARHEDFTVEFPQSGERLDRDGLRRLQTEFPGGAPEIRLRRLTGSGDVWVSETVIRYADGKLVYGSSVIEFRDGKIWRESRHFAEPFEAPAWRAQWVQRIEEPGQGAVTAGRVWCRRPPGCRAGRCPPGAAGSGRRCAGVRGPPRPGTPRRRRPG